MKRARFRWPWLDGLRGAFLALDMASQPDTSVTFVYRGSKWIRMKETPHAPS